MPESVRRRRDPLKWLQDNAVILAMLASVISGAWHFATDLTLWRQRVETHFESTDKRVDELQARIGH